MRVLEARALGRILMLGACWLAQGCATSSAPPGWLPEVEDVGADPYGGWIEVHRREGTFEDEGAEVIEGELIAVDSLSVWVLPLTGGAPLRVPVADVWTARVGRHESQHDKLSTWAVAGTFSTLSHGVLLLLSAPVWVLSGVGAAGAEADAALERYPQDGWPAVRRFARFPYGVPPGLEDMHLEPRPWSPPPKPGERLP